MVTYSLCDTIWSENFLFYHKACFPSFIYSNVALFSKIAYYLNSRALKLTSLQSKNICLFKFRWKGCKFEWKNESCYHNYHYWICLSMLECAYENRILNMPWALNMLNSEYGKVLNIAAFSICERYAASWIYQNMPWQSSEYILGSKNARILSMTGF